MSVAAEKTSLMAVAMLLLAVGGNLLLSLLQAPTLDVTRFAAAFAVTLLGAFLLLVRERSKETRWAGGKPPAAAEGKPKGKKPKPAKDAEE